MSDGTLYRISLDSEEQEILAEHLQKSSMQYRTTATR